MLKPDLPYFNDLESDTLPNGCAKAIDAHIHILPEKIFSSIWNWFVVEYKIIEL
jgi:hypothetical protein